jgi:hypothetical protein
LMIRRWEASGLLSRTSDGRRNDISESSIMMLRAGR